MFSFYRGEGMTDEAHEREVFSRIEKLLEKSEKRGFVLCHENEKDIYGDSPQNERKLLERFGGRLRAVLDCGNFAFCGMDASPAYALMKDYLEYMHIKDADENGVIVPPGLGVAGIRDTLAAIDRDFSREMIITMEPHLMMFTGLDKLRAGAQAGRVLAQYGEILAGALPEILPCIGCTQPSRWHCYDVWQHTAVAVGAVEAHALAQTLTGHGDARGARVLRWAALLHDLGKPACRTEDADGTAHFPGHNQRGGRMAREILLRLRAPASLTEGAAALVAVHDAPLPAADADILRLLHRRGAVFLRRLCQLKLADLAAHAQNAAVTARWQEVTQFAARMETLAADGCYRLDRLAVNGGDVLAAGLRPGPAVGQALDILLNAVMDGTLPNERTALLAALQRGFL